MSVSSAKFFISYRREDDPGFARLVFDRLGREFSPEQVFMDVEGISAGADFTQVIENQLSQCDVLFAIIGKGWLDAHDGQGHRRLDKATDFVRLEIESALRLAKTIIPVLVNNAEMPASDELPETLKPLAHINAVRLTHERFEADVQGIVNQLKRALKRSELTSGGRENAKVVFVSYPTDIDAHLMKRLGSALVRNYFRMWLYDPSPYGFSEDEVITMRWQRGGGNYIAQPLDAATAADAVMFLISRWTLKS
jgi:hypothetical protein